MKRQQQSLAEENQATEVEKRSKLGKDANCKNSIKEVAEIPSVKALLLQTSLENRIRELENELQKERQAKKKMEENYEAFKERQKSFIDKAFNQRNQANKEAAELKKQLDESMFKCSEAESKLKDVGKKLEKADHDNREVSLKYEKFKREAANYHSAPKERDVEVQNRLAAVQQQLEDANQKNRDASLKNEALKKKLKKYRNAAEFKAQEKEIVLNRPEWIIPQNVCQKMYEKTKDIELFVKKFVRRLFKKDVILPQGFLNRGKLKEAINVILFLWNVEDKIYKKVFVYLLKSEMRTLRRETRQKIYAECSDSISIGYTSDGKKIYFLWQPNNNRWEPFFDEEGRNPMEIAKTANSRTCYLNVAIPSKYSTSEYILFIQKTSASRICKIYKDGFIDVVFERKSKKP